MNRQEADPETYFTLITPTHRLAHAETFACIHRAQQAGVPFLWAPHVGDALIGRARSVEATKVLDKRYASPYAVFLDSDIVFTPEDLWQLWRDLQAGHDLIGGCYVIRSGTQMAHQGLGRDGHITLDGTIQEVEYLSAGFTGFSRGLLSAIVEGCDLPLCHPLYPPLRCYPFFQEGASFHERAHQWIWLSEDWYFCDLARRVGVRPHIDTRIQVGHEGSRTITVRDLDLHEG